MTRPFARVVRRAIPSLTALAVSASAAAAQARPTLATLPPESERQAARAIYQEMVEVKSGFTTGATTPLVELVAKRFRDAGFPASDIFIGGAAPHKMNLVVRYHGTGKKRPVLLLAHTDVVEAKREDWTIDPFIFTEKDGYFYGRGVGDDKSQAAAWVANLLRYKREGFKPERDLILALTADEEGGGPFNGVEWLLNNHRELIDAEYALNEGGWGESENGVRISNAIQLAEKWVMNVRLEVRNKGGHSSLPVPDNAIYQLAGGLERLSHFGFPVKVNEVSSAYFRAMAGTEKGPLKAELTAIGNGDTSAMTRVAKNSTQWNAMLRTTCIPTGLEGGHARNALPQLAVAFVNCRVMPEDTPEFVLASIRRAVADTNVVVAAEGTPIAGPASPMRDDVMETTRAVTSGMWPGVATVPLMVMGGTDGRYLRVKGIPTYGVEGMFYDRDDIRFHGRDERIRVQSFYEGQQFLYELVKRLSGRATGA
jgi:acetylornithine deacetylase/succinyl-diaminopimelate desuccinylase-like protein